jgi:hypothetical protein
MPETVIEIPNIMKTSFRPVQSRTARCRIVVHGAQCGIVALQALMVQRRQPLSLAFGFEYRGQVTC